MTTFVLVMLILDPVEEPSKKVVDARADRRKRDDVPSLTDSPINHTAQASLLGRIIAGDGRSAATFDGGW